MILYCENLPSSYYTINSYKTTFIILKLSCLIHASEIDEVPVGYG